MTHKTGQATLVLQDVDGVPCNVKVSFHKNTQTGSISQSTMNIIKQAMAATGPQNVDRLVEK